MSFGPLRQRLLSRYLGDGLGGAVGASLIGWSLGKLAEGIRREPEVLDVSRLIPGETYTVATRPAPRRRERKLATKARRAETRAAKSTKRRRVRRRPVDVPLTPRQQRRLAERDRAVAELAAERERAMARARRRRRPPRRVTFR